jgi:hypothetical protein
MGENMNDYFLIRDPFNNSYNPAKNFKLNIPDEKKAVKEGFMTAYKEMAKNQKLPFDF